MGSCRILASISIVTVMLGLSWSSAADDAGKAVPPGTLLVIDQGGKEHKLKAWKFTLGTRHLTWLAPAPPANLDKDKPKTKEEKDRPKAPAGPEALDVREDNSTNFARGILTLVPLDRVRSIDFDSEKQTSTVRVATSDKPEDDETLTGTTKYQGENKLGIDAEVDKGDMGVAEIKFRGGVPKGIRGVRFPAPPAPDKVPAWREGKVTAGDKEKRVHKASDFQVLYRMPDGSLRVLPTLMFKKTLKVELAKLKTLKVLASPPKEGAECKVIFKDGEEQTLTMLRVVPIDGKNAALEGLIGRVKVGYRIFPVHAIAELQLDD